MDGKRDLNISGNKIINVQWPTENDDVATKRYVDALHLMTPTDNIWEYIRYINWRNNLLYSIAGLVLVKSDMEYHHARHYNGKDMHFWVESPTSTLEYWLRKNKQLVGKSIEVVYQFPVHVLSWKLNMCRDKYEDWEITFQWQVSDDGFVWIYHGQPSTATTKEESWCGNNTLLELETDHDFRAAKHWRISFVEASTNDNTIYINYLRMIISA